MAIAFLAGASLACEKGDAPSAASPRVEPKAARPTVVDEATAAHCEARYACALSHPGLGTSSRSTRVDLATCTWTRSTQQGAFGGPLDASTDGAPLFPEDCSRMRRLLASLTEEDIAAAQEPARVDMTACTFTVFCGPGGDKPVLSVQRETSFGPNPVVRLIQAVESSPSRR